MTEQHMAWSVGQLITFLQRCDPTSIIILSRDPEGNGYSPLRTAATTYYRPETSYNGEIDDTATDMVPSVALWPLN